MKGRESLAGLLRDDVRRENRCRKLSVNAAVKPRSRFRGKPDEWLADTKDNLASRS
jgi:hypothetical protein